MYARTRLRVVYFYFPQYVCSTKNGGFMQFLVSGFPGILLLLLLLFLLLLLLLLF
jgi:hypothetical protein